MTATGRPLGGHWVATARRTAPLKRVGRLEGEAAAAEAAGSSCEASMVLRRLQVYRVTQRAPQPRQQIVACPCCFAHFVFEGEAASSRKVSAPARAV